jgi:hypothetical protein
MKTEIINCDICGNRMPEDGYILDIQDARKEEIAIDGYYDICDECHDYILNVIIDRKQRKE